jgi:aromatic ring-cleaving dioxygenase
MTQYPAAIAAWHAHVYFNSPEARLAAARLRDAVAGAFPAIRLGGWHDRPVGPHSQPMYQILFAPHLFAVLVPWLMLNRTGLSILIHPETGDDYVDHAEHAGWLGPALPLRLEMLRQAQ